MKNTELRKEIVELLKTLRKAKLYDTYELMRYTGLEKELIGSEYHDYDGMFSFREIKEILAQQPVGEDKIYLRFYTGEDYDGFAQPLIRFIYLTKESDEEYLYRLKEYVLENRLLDKVSQLGIKLEQQLGLKLNTYQLKKLIQVVKSLGDES